MTVYAVDTIAVVVSDARKAIGWYRDVLGLRVAHIGPPVPHADASIQGSSDHPGHWIELGPGRPQTRVHLCELEGKTEPGPTGITFLTDDIQAEHERMQARGVRFLNAPQRMDWGEWICAFVDPDGNEFDLKQPGDG